MINALETLHLPKKMHKKLTLATLDVNSLYPSIPQALGINMALQQAIRTQSPNSTENRRKNMLKEMLLILRENTFGFADRDFRQLKGVAMGTPVAPTLANLFMDKVEAEALSTWTGTQPIIWLHFIDDILVLLENDRQEMMRLVSHCNSRMANIHYTAEVSDTCVDYLDNTIFKGQRYERTGILDIKPFQSNGPPLLPSLLVSTSPEHQNRCSQRRVH